MSDIRDTIIQIAAAEIGTTNAQKYWSLVLGNEPYSAKVSWCGIFSLWCLKTAGLVDWNWQIGSGFVGPHKLPKTNNPLPGDIAIKEVPYVHHMIIKSVDLTANTAIVIAGNTPNVKEYQINLTGIDIYSIQDLVYAYDAKQAYP